MECQNSGKAVKRVRFTWRGLKSGQRTFLSVFCVGFFAGIIILNIARGILLEDTGLFDEETLTHMKYMTVDSNALFCYIFRKRISRALVTAVLSTTYLGLAACIGLSFWYGLSAGVFLAVLALRYGLKGILLAAVCVLPQYLLYAPAALALLTWCETLFRGIYVRREFDVSDRGFLMKKAGRLVVILAAMTVGCLLEGYMNPYLLLGFLKFF